MLKQKIDNYLRNSKGQYKIATKNKIKDVALYLHLFNKMNINIDNICIYGVGFSEVEFYAAIIDNKIKIKHEINNRRFQNVRIDFISNNL